MPLRSWLPFSLLAIPGHASSTASNIEENRQPPVQSSEETPPSPPFNEIVNRFDALSREVTRLQLEAVDQQTQISRHLKLLQDERGQKQQLNTQFQDLRKKLDKETENTRALQNAIYQTYMPQQHKLKELRRRGETLPFTQMLKVEDETRKTEINRLRSVCNNLEHKLDAADQDRRALAQQVEEYRLKNCELVLDVEYLRCTSWPPPSPKQHVEDHKDIASLPDVPFVLVLIDGDAYQFAEILPNQYSDPSIRPATRMARNIQEYLRTYIYKHGLPAHCKLMVRVLANVAGLKTCKAMGYFRREQAVVDAIEDFMARFTEFAPLFEFFDAGVGKERVDGKIHELYSTFISNPSCRKIFVAAARDNGFARMFEQNIHYPEARAKTCLVSAGDIAQEIAALDLETVEWPAVFARQFRPRDVEGKIHKREMKRQRIEEQQLNEKARMIRKLGHQGYQDMVEKQAFQQFTKALVGEKTAAGLVQELVGFGKRVTGVRTESAALGQSSSTEDADDEIVGGHEGLCVEVGVD